MQVANAPGRSKRSRNHRVFTLEAELRGPVRGLVRWPLERLLCFGTLNEIHAAAAGRGGDFLDNVIAALGISCRVADGELENIPRTGPAVVVCNHPFGAVDGIILAHLLRRVRPDVKIMANYQLGRIPELRELFLFVDPFNAAASARFNVKALKQTLSFVRGGGLLAVFPAGEVAHLQVRRRRIVESPWSDTIARIIRRVQCPAVPVRFDGGNSVLFHAAGLVHRRLRTVMLPRELLKKRGACVGVHIGRAIPARTLCAMASDERMTEYLRLRTEMLAHRCSASHRQQPPVPATTMSPIAAPVPPELLAGEVAALPPQQVLLENEQYQVLFAPAGRIPHILRELGRLREISFRGTGEGTGQALDLDRFDQWYVHLFLWQRQQRQIAGAYRLGPTDLILPRHGQAGLYTSTLFDYSLKLLEQLGPSLELGRSFIRPEYQKSYAPLLLLWKGIGQYIVRHPRYRVMFGPVSISNEYQSMSRQLMVSFLKMHSFDDALARYVRPRTPFREAVGAVDPAVLSRVVTDVEAVDDLIAELEQMPKGVPVLLRQYLKLGGRVLGFNVDAHFGNCLDGLVMVDLMRTDARILGRYLGEAGAAAFRAFHQTPVPASI